MPPAFQTVAKFTQFLQKIIFLHALALKKLCPVFWLIQKTRKNSDVLYSISVFLKDPIRNTEVFLLLSFKPDIDLKASNISISSLNDLKEPFSANVAPSAKSVLLNSLSNIGIPLKSLFSLTAAASSSMHIINR